MSAQMNAKRTWTSISEPGQARRIKHNLAWRIFRTVLLVGMSVVVLLPVVWTFVSSFKTPTELAARPPVLFPSSWNLDNYRDALAQFDFGSYIGNSIFVTVMATALTVVINVMCAYGLAKYNFRGRNVLFLIVLATIMVPLQVIFIPVYQMAASLGLVNSLWGMIIPPAATPTGVFLIRQYMLSIPDELIEAARVDGSGEFRTFLRVVVPLCGPPIAVVTIFSIMWRWNDFLWPMIIAQDSSLYTLPVALAQFNSQLTVPFNYLLAMSVVSMLPVIIVFLFLQKYIVAGIANTGIK